MERYATANTAGSAIPITTALPCIRSLRSLRSVSLRSTSLSPTFGLDVLTKTTIPFGERRIFATRVGRERLEERDEVRPELVNAAVHLEKRTDVYNRSQRGRE